MDCSLYTKEVFQNKEIAATNMKDCWMIEKFCFSKNGLTYPNKISKIIISFLYFIEKTEEISFAVFRTLGTIGTVSIGSIR